MVASVFNRLLSRRANWTGLLLAAAVLFASAAALDAAAPSARIGYKLPKTTTLGEPAILTVELSNTTGARIVADFGVDDQTQFVFRHRRPDGTQVTAAPAIAGRGRTSRLMLRGNTRAVLVVLDEWLDLSQVGRHAIDVEFRGSVEIEGGAQAALQRRASLVLDVKPRDGARLEKRAGQWLKQVSTLAPGSESRAAAAALIAMSDPVVIPYLELATARTRDVGFATALAAMNHPEARAALERLANSPDAEVRAIAQRAVRKQAAAVSVARIPSA
jgi:hypothetical protein